MFLKNKPVGLGRLALFLTFVLTAALMATTCGGDSAPKAAVVYKVYFNADGGEPVPEPQLVPGGGKVNEPEEMTRDKSSFRGWYKDMDGEEPWDFDSDVVEHDTFLFAAWGTSVSKGGGGGGGGVGSGPGPVVNNPTPPETGKTLGGSVVQGAGTSSFRGVATDSAGNVYAVGSQYGTGAYVYGSVATATAPAATTSSVLVKYDPGGSALWASALKAGTTGYSAGFNGVATDLAGNVYAVGQQNGAGTYVYGSVATATAPAAATTSSMLVKYDPGGNALWAKTLEAGTIGKDANFAGVATDSAGNVYAVGIQRGPDAYVYGSSATATGVSLYGSNPVLVKYDPGGSALWAKTFEAGTTSSNGEFNGVATDSAGYVYVLGYQFGGDGDYGSGVIASGQSSVLVKYDPSGSALWAKTLGGSSAYFESVTTDSAGNVYIVGYHFDDGTYDYGSGVTAKGTAMWCNPVLVKYDSSGSAQWASTLKAGTTGTDAYFYDVAVDGAYVYAVGEQYDVGAYVYGSGATATGILTGSNSVLVKYDSSGKALWAKTLGAGTTGTGARFMGVAGKDGNVYAVGDQKDGDYDYGDGHILTGSSSSSNSMLVKYGN